jgi:pimeloyl-ACP methyl ester carboxylesterase
MRRALAIILVVVLLVVGGFLLYITVKPLGAETLAAQPDPASSREEALARWAEVEARDDETIDERCGSWSLIHEEPVETTVVLLHGYTNCPYMFRRLGADLHEIGWNVLAPRYPYHGYVDKLSPDQGKLTAEDLVRVTDEAIDIAEGLGDRVVVGGLSAGGVAAAWAAQNRPEVDHVVGLAPMVNLRPIPDWFAAQVVNAVTSVPDIQYWWDPGKREMIPPDYGYPKLSSHAVAQLIRLGMVTLEQARSEPHTAEHVVLTTNPNDGAVKPGTVEAIVEAWQESGASASVYEWPEEMGLGHNMVDDAVNTGKFEEIYPILMDLFTEGRVTTEPLPRAKDEVS